MAGAAGSGQDIQTGRVNRAEGRTILWAQAPPGERNFNGSAIMIVEVAEDVEEPDDYEAPGDFVPTNHFDGIRATGHSGGSPSNWGGTVGASGVVGRGGRNQGTGVVGLGGGTPTPGDNGGAGGIGIHGFGGPQADFFADPTTPPGAGVVGQGGRQSEMDNRLRLPHAAGIIAIGGGADRNTDLLSSHTLTETGGVGLYAQGAEADATMVRPVDEAGNLVDGPDVPSGPLAPGVGVLGRGGIATVASRVGPAGAGVVGLAGGSSIPHPSETAGTGVYGAGSTGVRGVADSGRGGVFESASSAQAQLVPQKSQAPFPPLVPATPKWLVVDEGGDFQLPRDGQAGDLLTLLDDQRRCTLWLCVSGIDAGPSAQWAEVLLGTAFDGRR